MSALLGARFCTCTQTCTWNSFKCTNFKIIIYEGLLKFYCKNIFGKVLLLYMTFDPFQTGYIKNDKTGVISGLRKENLCFCSWKWFLRLADTWLKFLLQNIFLKIFCSPTKDWFSEDQRKKTFEMQLKKFFCRYIHT